MFGRVRAASSTPDSLELERPPSKLIKDDPLSIYEATLMKLKLGSRRDLGSSPESAMETETDFSSASVPKFCSDALSSHCEEENCNSLNLLKCSQLVSKHEKMMMVDSDCSSASISPSYSDCQSTGSLQQHQSRNLTILYMFSKFRSSGLVKTSSQGELMMMENGNSCVSISPSSSDCQSLRSTNITET